METGIYSSNVCRLPFEEVELKLMNTNPIEVLWDEFNRKHYKPNTNLIHYKLMALPAKQEEIIETFLLTPEQMMIVIKSPYSYYGNRIGIQQIEGTGFVKRFTGNDFLMGLVRREDYPQTSSILSN